MRAVTLLLGAFSCQLLGAGVHAQQGGRQLVVPRAQPSVLQLVSAFDARVTRPANLDWAADRSGQSVVQARYAAARPTDVSAAEFAWQCIAEDPGRCLRLSGGPTSFMVQDLPMSSGTGFVVDAAGTLLTNQHVIAPELLANDPDALGAFAAEDMHEMLRSVVRLVGAPAPRELLGALDATLLPWLLSTYRVSDITLHEVRVTTHLKPQALGMRLRLQVTPAAPQPDWKQSTVPCQVLVTGEVYPGRDVAVLRAADLADKLISLPLGDSRRTLPGTRIVALGFPGAAAETYGVDADAARFRVIAHDGIVDQRLPVKGGWEAFHMTAHTNHGDSGGPVLDESGHVIAMTVAGNPRAPAQNLSIPIEIARQQLQRANVVLWRNKVTETWNHACDELQANRVAEALPLFEEVNRLQGGWVLAGVGGLGTSQASDMIQMCRRELGLPEVGSLPVGVAPKPRAGLVPAPPSLGPQAAAPKPLLVRTTSAEEPWWETVWSAYRGLSLPLQVVLPIALLAGVFELLRRLHGWLTR
jgi:S1-C subfamily serine protease